tara:strand:- start:12 stop:440 length:429 start_codon:yes stop_codon:yes gene_type:complete
MLQPPPIKEMPGFSVKVQPRDMNITSGNGIGGELVEDWYWRVDIKCDGTNPNWPEPFEELVLVSRLANSNTVPNVDSDIPTIILEADDSPTEIRVEECKISNTLGLWCTVECDNPKANVPDGIQLHMMFIDELPEIAGMTMM